MDDGETEIRLTADIDTTETLSVSKDFTVDLNGHTWTRNPTTEENNSTWGGYDAFEVTAGTLRITNGSNGKIVSAKESIPNGTSNTGTINVTGSGSLVIDGTAVDIETNYNAICHSSSGTITIKNSTINSNHIGISVSKDDSAFTAATGKITIEDSTINGKKNGDDVFNAIYNAAGIDIDIKNSSVSSEGSNAITNSGGTVSLDNATVSGGAYGVVNNNSGTVNITNGSSISGRTGINNNNAGSVIVSDSTVKGTTYGFENYTAGSVTVNSGLVEGFYAAINMSNFIVNGGSIKGSSVGIFNAGNNANATISGGTLESGWAIYAYGGNTSI